MILYDKYGLKANRASFIITPLLITVKLSFFEFNTFAEVQAQVESQSSYEKKVLDQSLIERELNSFEDVKTAEPEKTADNDVKSEEKIAVKVKNEKKTEKRTEKKNYSKKENKTVKKSAKTDKKLLNSDNNSTKSSEKQNSQSSSKSEKPLNETYERKQTGHFTIMPLTLCCHSCHLKRSIFSEQRD